VSQIYFESASCVALPSPQRAANEGLVDPSLWTKKLIFLGQYRLDETHIGDMAIPHK